MSFVTHKLIKPDTVEARLYQEVLVSRIIEKGNTLVVAPTALGKTLVAVMLAAYVLEKHPEKKILFLAPTKPLVTQHETSFKKFFNIHEEEIVSITGSNPINQRTEIYKNKKIIQATPQTIENDLISGKLNLKEFGLVIFDEAHRAVGDYAYVFVNLQLQKQNSNCLVLALTASPGSEEEHIQDVCKNLSIKNIEIKDQTDLDVKPYVNEIEIDWVKVDLPKDFITIKSHLEEFQKKQLIALKSLGFAQTENKKYYNKFRLLEMQANIRKRLITHGSTQPSLFYGASKCASMIKISHAEELIETQGIGALNNYFNKLTEEANHGKSKAARQIIADEDIKIAILLTKKLFEEKVQHPKYAELKKIILNQINNDPKSKVIVFNHYRDSITEVVEFLTTGEGAELIKPRKFIGQATKGKEKGMSQKIQQEVLEELRNDVHNVLVASSVAEEGLDIPTVDLVIFFEPVPSEIRTIQRRGRTGRHHKGKMIVLMAKNTRDEAFFWTAKSKERKMKETLHSMKKNNSFILEQKPKEQTILNEFDTKEQNEKIIIFSDSREQASNINKELFSHEDVKLITKPLDIGDYVLSKDVCVERKTIEDFLNSMIDGRLFTQINNLRQNYAKPLIILEGNTTELFTLRNIHKNSIFGALTSIALDYQVPLLNSKDSNETAQILYVIAKREQKTNNKEVRIRVGRKGLTLSEQQRFIIEGFPLVGPNLAKALLEKFGSIKNIVNASEKELQELENLGKKKANLIQKVLREKYDENKSTLKELEGDKELDDEEIQKAFDENNSNSNEEEVIIDEE
ncbi:MAG: DEAD/DEAH box helicase [Candidatus ainarchaeum sp.]|nr:DEAD/DEAH box helicase [Candidatus ainarchaeum sp.]MDD4468021.1 DEAD/DEAH box helicase [Candidatus ainarchaeum sp.]